MSTETERQIADEAKVCAQNYHPLPVVLTRGEGVYVWDVEGRRYLDMMSAYSAVSHGHAHPALLAVLSEQAARLAVPSRAYHNDRLGPFLAKLCAIAGMDRALPMNTGAEAVETAIKAVRRWGYRNRGIADGRAEIIVADGNFHGRTTTIVGFSSEAAYRHQFGPFTPGFVTVPFGDAAAVEAAIGDNTCAVLVEPIQGEAGIVLPPDGYLSALREICTRRGILLVFDEVQSGLGRTGRWFAWQHENARPDGMILGKALGGGLLPVSAFLGTAEIMDAFEPGSHGSTFGGNALSAAVALEALLVLERDGLVEASRDMGAYLLEQVAALASPVVRTVRGRGLWVAVEIDPAYTTGREICEALLAEGVLSKETHDTVVRLAPPLTITRAQIDEAVDALRRVLSRAQATYEARTAGRATPIIAMCAPEHFEVSYQINPWMQPAAWATAREQHHQAAVDDWNGLTRTLTGLGARLELVPAQPGLPDLVFTANAAVVMDGKALVARFRHPERRGEELHYQHFFEQLQRRGLLDEVRTLPEGVILEGAGDCVWDQMRQTFWVGWGPRSSQEAADVVEGWFGRDAQAVELVDPRFYHMDTALVPLSGPDVLWVPDAFSDAGKAVLRERIGGDNLIAVPEDDACLLAANAVVLGRDVVLGRASERFEAMLSERGYRVHRAGLASFWQSGGSAFCLTLRLDHGMRVGAQTRIAAPMPA
jgi:ornithine aminotransferase